MTIKGGAPAVRALVESELVPLRGRPFDQAAVDEAIERARGEARTARAAVARRSQARDGDLRDQRGPAMTRLAVMIFARSRSRSRAARAARRSSATRCRRSAAPPPSSGEAELRVRGWRDGLDTPHDDALQAYVARVTARVARASHLTYVPDLVLTTTGIAAAAGHTIAIGREAVVALGSESELAAILAHEIVHLEVHDGHEAIVRARLDEEAIADERAIELLDRAGYPRSAMAVALARILHDQADDAEHPPRADRLAHTTALAGSAATGDDGRRELLAAISGAVVGRVLEDGLRVGEVWVVDNRGIAVLAPDGGKLEEAATMANSNVRPNYFAAFRIGAGAGRALAAELEHATTERFAIGVATLGRLPAEPPTPVGSLAQLLARRRAEVGWGDPSSAHAIVETPGGYMMFTADLGRNRARRAARVARAHAPPDRGRASRGDLAAPRR